MRSENLRTERAAIFSLSATGMSEVRAGPRPLVLSASRQRSRAGV
jgi:hypothetical protein